MAVPLHGGFSGMPLADVGLGPGNNNAEPRWRCTDQSITPANIVQWIDLADQYDFTIVHRVAGNRGDFCNPGPPTPGSPNGTLIYDESQFRTNVERFAGIAAYADAVTRRRIISWTVDEPYIQVFNGSIPKAAQNKMGLIIKEYWADALTAQRASFQFLSPPPAGGWTGLDYGISQYDPISPKAGISMAQFFASEKPALLGINLGMIPSLNWLNSGDGRLWDFLNTGSSSGRIQGASGAGFWLVSPPEIGELADLLWNDADAIGFLGYQYIHPNFPEQQFRAYQDRSDYVAAFDYLLTRFAARPTFNGYRTPKGMVVVPPSTGDEIDHFFSTPVTSRVTTTSATYVDVPGATIPSANLTAGKKYLLVVTGQCDLNSATQAGYIRVVSGSTPLPRAESAWQFETTAQRQVYFYWAVHTAVAGDDLTLQFRTSDGVATIGAQFCQLVAINLSDALQQGVDWQHAESAASTALTTSYQDGASFSLTPAVAGQSWLVLTSMHATPAAAGSLVSGLRRSGEATQTDPEVQMEGRDARDRFRLCTAKVLTLGAVSNTFAEQAKHTGAGGPRDGSAVFALRLHAFAARAAAYDNAPQDYGQADYGTAAASATLTPTVEGDIWVLGSLGMIATGRGIRSKQRLQIDNADAPAGQTAAGLTQMLSNDATDVLPILLQSALTATAAAHTLELEGSTPNSVAAGRGARGRLVVGITMRLASAVGGSTFRHRKTSFTSKLGTKTGTRKAG